MKKIYVLLALLGSSSLLVAQNAATPNAGFEAWTHVSGFTAYDNPDNWSTLNSTTAPFGVITCYKATAGGEFHTGAAALKLITKNAVIQTANGIATTGTINTSNQTITGGIAFTARPDSIVGWYKCSPVSNDAGFVQFMLLDGSSDTIGYAKFQAPSTPTATFTRFAVAISYYNTQTPVTSQWICSSSAGSTNQQINATIWVDDLDLTYAPNSITEAGKQSGIKVGPVPAANELLITNRDQRKATLVLYNTLGQTCGTFPLEGASQKIDISAIAQGSYVYSVLGENRELLVNGKLLIQR